MNIRLVDQPDVLGVSLVGLDGLYASFLDSPRFFNDSLVSVRDELPEKPLPFAVGKPVVVQGFDPFSEIRNQLLFRVDLQTAIALPHQQPDKFLFQVGFTLVGIGTLLNRLIFRDNGIFRCLRDDI